MKLAPTITVLNVTQLSDLKPNLVSLVKAGANQEPFLVLKFDEQPTDSTAMKHVSKSDQPAILKNGVTAHSAIFKGDNFKDEAAITAWLSGKGFEGYKIEKVDDAFRVSDGTPEDHYEKLSPINVEPGVVLMVGVKKADLPDVPATTPAPAATASTEAPVVKTEGGGGEGSSRTRNAPVVTPPTPSTVATNAPAAPDTSAPVAKSDETKVAPKHLAIAKNDKTPERISKFDYYIAYYESNGLTIAEVLRDAQDGIPVGYYDVRDAFEGALANLILVGKVEDVGALCAEFAAAVKTLANLSISTKGDLSAEAVSAAVVKADYSKLPAPVKKSDAPATPPATTPAAPVFDLSPILKQLEAMNGTLTGMAAKVEKAEQTATAAQAEVKNLTERTEKAEEAANKALNQPVRKGASLEEMPQGATTVQKDGQKRELTRLEKDEMGIRD